MSSSRARHRAPVARFAWASRALLSAAAVPVGALAGCAVAAVSSSADRPEVGVAGLAVAGVPLGVHGWRQRTARPAVRGRHAAGGAGVAGIWPEAAVARAVPAAEALEAALPAAPAPAPAPRFVTVRIQAPRAAVPTTAADRALPPLPRQRTAADLATATRPATASPVVVTVSTGRRLLDAGRAAQVAELQRIWDSGTGPQTGAVPVPALPDVAAAVALAGDVRRRHAA